MYVGSQTLQIVIHNISEPCAEKTRLDSQNPQGWASQLHTEPPGMAHSFPQDCGNSRCVCVRVCVCVTVCVCVVCVVCVVPINFGDK